MEEYKNDKPTETGNIIYRIRNNKKIDQSHITKQKN